MHTRNRPTAVCCCCVASHCYPWVEIYCELPMAHAPQRSTHAVRVRCVPIAPIRVTPAWKTRQVGSIRDHLSLSRSQAHRFVERKHTPRLPRECLASSVPVLVFPCLVSLRACGWGVFACDRWKMAPNRSWRPGRPFFF